MPTWDLLLRGAVAGVLALHLMQLMLPGPRAAARAALAAFTLSLLAYLVCQRGGMLLTLPRPLSWFLLALCVSVTAWLWLAARSLFDDRFSWRPALLLPVAAVMALGLASALPRLEALRSGAADPGFSTEASVHAAAMILATGAALWEVWRGWRDDLVEPRRVARRWVALGIGVYAAIALVIELAVRGGPVDPLLPSLHVAGIGAIAMALAVLVGRLSLDAVLGGTMPPPTAATPEPSAARVPGSPALQRLLRAMSGDRAYRREGLTLAALASDLGMGETALRALINQELGHRNFNDFLHHHRLQEAAGRLATEDLPVLTIALECGYGSIGPFNRAFRQRFAMTPTEYRAAARVARPTPGG